MTCDHRPGIPPFVAVYDRLRELMRREGLAPGDPLPSEVLLGGELGVTRELVREALLLLEEDGYLARDRERRWVVASPTTPASFTAPFPQLLGREVTPVRRLHAATENGSTWSRALLASEGPFVVWETVFALDGVLLASTLEVMLESAVPTELADADHLDVAARPTLLGCLDAERRGEMTLDSWRLTPLSRNTERLSWMELPMHGFPAGLTVVLAEGGSPTYLAKNLFDLGTFTLSVVR